MKRILSAVMATLMLLSLCACAGGGGGEQNEDKKPGVFRVGYGKGDITPTELGVPMNGYALSTERLSTGLLSYIYCMTLAVQDADGNTALILSVDNCQVDSLGEETRDWASQTYGIPRENIIVSTIHQHSSPNPHVKDWPTSVRYRVRMLEGMKDSVTKAMEDLAPAQMYINTATTEGLSFVRQYIMSDGSIAGDNYGTTAGLTIKGHESDADKEMRMVKFVREGDKKDIIVVNFQGHPHIGTSGSSTDIHSDWPGVMREEVAKTLGCEAMYISGAGGNLNSHSWIDEENITRNRDHVAHGKRAAQYVINAEDRYTKVEVGKVVAKEMVYKCEADHSMDHLYEQAKKVADARQESSAKAEQLLKKYPKLHSIYHASSIVAKYNEGKYVDMTIGAVAFGDVVFTSHPYEMFDENGMELRAGSANHINKNNYDADDQLENPYKMTMICTMTNLVVCYVPSHRGYVNGGYSTDTTKVAPGSGERLVGEYLRILNELHG